MTASPITPPIAVNLSTIPTSLQATKRWVTWKLILDPKRPEKPKKMPFQAITPPASAKSNDAATWASFKAAVIAYRTNHHAGIGFMLGDGWAGVDFDGCYDPETGMIADWAKPWIVRLASYAEVSPSGTGIKVIIHADIPKPLKLALGDHIGVEVYGAGRYFTITGHRLDGFPAEPQEAQAAVDAILTHYRPTPAPTPVVAAPAPPTTPVSPQGDGWHRARAVAVDLELRRWVQHKCDQAAEYIRTQPGNFHNARFTMARLLGGVMSVAPSHLSEQEAIHVLYQARIPDSHQGTELKAIIDGLRNGQTAPLALDDLPQLPTDDDPIQDAQGTYCPRCTTRLSRSKYDYPGGGPGWFCPRCKHPMIWPLNAVSPASATPTPASTSRTPAQGAGVHILWGNEIDHIVAPRQLVKGYLTTASVALLIGPSEAGKSTIAVDLGCKVSQHYPVIYVAGEDTGNVRTQIRAWEMTNQKSRGRIGLVDGPVLLGVDSSVEAFLAAVLPVEPKLIIIDTLSSCIPGMDENSSEMTVVSFNLNRIADATGAAVLVLHHPLKYDSGQFRGHSSLLNNTHTMLVAERDEGDDLVILKVTRHKGKRAEPASLRLIIRPTDITDPDEGQLSAPVVVPAARIILSEDHVSLRQKAILEYLEAIDFDGGATTSEICRIIATLKNVQEGVVRKDINSLAKRGMIGVFEGQGKPRKITDKGRARIGLDRVDRVDRVVPGDPFIINTCLGESQGIEDNPIHVCGDNFPHQDAVFDEPDPTRSEPDPVVVDRVPDSGENPIHPIQSFRLDRVDRVFPTGEEKRETVSPSTESLPALPALPPGCRLVTCDHTGTPTRYGIYRKVVGPDGEETDLDQHTPTVVSAAWRRWSAKVTAAD